MPIESSPFEANENMDDPDENIPRGQHKLRRNVVPRGPNGNIRWESIPGNVVIANPFLPTTGPNSNKCIAAYYDSVYQRIFVWNYNTSALHAIYVYFTQTHTWATLLANGSATDGDILNFLPQTITSINIDYRENVDGNILFYVDSLGRPTALNIERYLTNPYPVTKRAFIDVAKAPPVMPPRVTYENDNSATVNNLKNALFQFREVFVYDDFQKSVGSTGSIVPLPVNYGDQENDSDPTKNSRIAVYVSTGDADVKKLEIWGTQYSDAVTPAPPGDNLNILGDYFLIATIDKALLGIPDNDVYRFVFRNDAVYPPISLVDKNLLFSWVPQRANAGELLNGNIPIYGGITEGYDPVQVGLSASVIQNYYLTTYGNGILMLASQGGVDSNGTGTTLRIDITGSGTNNTANNLPIFLDTITDTNWSVYATDSTGANISFTTGSQATGNISSILTLLGNAAVAQGFTVVSNINNTLILNFAGGFTLNYGENTVGNYTRSNPALVKFAYPDSSAEQFAIQYYDRKGRTNGAQLSSSAIIKTLQDDTGLSINTITLSVTSRPPLWAAYYDIVRAYALTYDKRLFWISNQTFVHVDLNTNIKYAYIGITYMSEYDKNIEAATNVVSYQFTPGDRIQFQVRYAQDGSENNYSSPIDLEIVSVEQNVVAEGTVQRGTFIKVVYPTAIAPAQIDFGGADQQWYKCLIYSFIKHGASPTTEVFYEFGKRFGIGNPGTANAYHIGESQSQNATLSQPAIITTSDGDLFYRQRSVPVGVINYLTTNSIRYSDRYANIPVAIPGGDIVNAQFELRTVAFTSSNTNNQDFTSGNYLFWNKLTTPVTIRVIGNYTLVAEEATDHKFMFKLSSPLGVNRYVNLVSDIALNLTINQNQQYIAEFDQYIEIPANTKVFDVCYSQSVTGVATLNVGAFKEFYFAIQSNFIIPIIESSYSDKYNIVCNSNSRPTVFDPNAKQQFFPTLMRWGLADQLNTNINQSNVFLFQNSDEVDLGRGQIMRLVVRGRELIIFQYRGTGRTGIYSRFLKQNDGTDVVATTNEIISANNVEYYAGEYGVGNQAASVVKSGMILYYADPVKGYYIRLAQDGQRPISLDFKVQQWAGTAFPTYITSFPYVNGGNSEILGCCYFANDRESEIIVVTQGNASIPDAGQSHSFDEKRNAWTSFYDYSCDAIVCAENTLYTFFLGEMYEHTPNAPAYCNFYGNQYHPSVTIVKNEAPNLKKRWINIDQVSNVAWLAPEIYTQNVNYGTRQESNLVAEDFEDLESGFSANFKGDLNSPGGIADGDALHGTFIVMVLQPEDGSVFNFLSSVAVKFIPSYIVEK